MSVARWLETKIDVDPKKPGRRQEVFDLKAIEKALGAPITHVYSNQIQPARRPGCTTTRCTRSRSGCVKASSS